MNHLHDQATAAFRDAYNQAAHTSALIDTRSTPALALLSLQAARLVTTATHGRPVTCRHLTGITRRPAPAWWTPAHPDILRCRPCHDALPPPAVRVCALCGGPDPRRIAYVTPAHGADGTVWPPTVTIADVCIPCTLGFTSTDTVEGDPR